MTTVESGAEQILEWTEDELPGVTAEMKLAATALDRDLPALILSHPGEFVAYHGAVCIGINESPFVLEDLCCAYPIGTCLVAPIAAVDNNVGEPFCY